MPLVDCIVLFCLFQVVADGVDATADKDAVRYKDEVPVVHAEQGHSNDPENGVLSASDENLYYAEDQQLKIENVSSEREIAVPTESNSSYEQAEVVSGNEASRMEV